MLDILRSEMRDFGRPPKLSRVDQLLLTLIYLREYRTQFHIGVAYGVSEATVCRTIQKIEDTLMQSREFRLPGKKKLQESDTQIEMVLVDVAEQPMERQKKQKDSYSGKKKRHTQKAQVIVNKETAEIIATAFDKGSVHDYMLFKLSRIGMIAEVACIADAGYQGLMKLHENSQTPQKKSKKHPLTRAQKKSNRQLSSQRILVESVIGRLKVFRILSERYRNRRKRFGLRFNLIAAIYNFELSLN